jgi:protein gp37
MNKTRIDWADTVWNPVWGCDNNCAYCYARSFAKRYGKKLIGRDDFVPTWVEKNLWRRWRKAPARIFVNSMSDISCWKTEWMARTLTRIKSCPQHAFLFLTKRPATYYRHSFPDNCWLGATATTENEVCTYQDDLRLAGGEHIRFLSIEPIMERIGPDCIDPDSIDWLIVGAETGNRRGKVHPEREWIEALRTCGVPVFEKESLRALMGGELVQQFPEAK